MAKLSYNGVQFGQVRTINFGMEAVYDRSRTDLIMHKVTIDVQGVINPSWLTTNAPGRAGQGRLQERPEASNQGDRAGIAIHNLRRTLLQPRGRLLFQVGPDLVIDSPGFDRANGSRFACDARNGPFPISCRIVEIMGDHSALCQFSVETYVCDQDNFVLSNRWTQAAQIDAEGYTTRVTRGLATFRTDFLKYRDRGPDDFRKFLFVPTSDGQQRVSVHVEVSEDGSELAYTAVDRDQTYGIGENSEITRIEGNCTMGAELPTKDLKTAVNKVGGISGALSWVVDLFSQGGRAVLLSNAVGVLWEEGVANTRANVMVRCFGNRKASKAAMAKTAYLVALDRFAPLQIGVGFHITSAYLTQDFSSGSPPFVELRMEFFVANSEALAFIADPLGAVKLMNLDTGFDKLGMKVEGKSPKLRVSDNTCGAFVKNLVSQALKGQNELAPRPAEPPSRESPTYT